MCNGRLLRSSGAKSQVAVNRDLPEWDLWMQRPKTVPEAGKWNHMPAWEEDLDTQRQYRCELWEAAAGSPIKLPLSQNELHGDVDQLVSAIVQRAKLLCDKTSSTVWAKGALARASAESGLHFECRMPLHHAARLLDLLSRHPNILKELGVQHVSRLHYMLRCTLAHARHVIGNGTRITSSIPPTLSEESETDAASSPAPTCSTPISQEASATSVKTPSQAPPAQVRPACASSSSTCDGELSSRMTDTAEGPFSALKNTCIMQVFQAADLEAQLFAQASSVARWVSTSYKPHVAQANQRSVNIIQAADLEAQLFAQAGLAAQSIAAPEAVPSTPPGFHHIPEPSMQLMARATRASPAPPPPTPVLTAQVHAAIIPLRRMLRNHAHYDAPPGEDDEYVPVWQVTSNMLTGPMVAPQVSLK